MQTHMETESQPGLTDLVSGIVQDAQHLMRQQLTLFQVEVKNDLHKTIAASVPMVAGAIVCLLGGIAATFALGYLLPTIWPNLPLWGSFAIVGGLWLALGATLLICGKLKFQAFNPLPEQTVEALKENIQWKTKR